MATPQPSSTDDVATPRPPADVILNDQVGWPKSPGQDVTLKDALGFATDRLYHVPAAGVHPRILFSPDDLPRVRKQLADTAAGKAFMATIRENLAKGIDQSGTWENNCFAALLHGDSATFDRLYKPDYASRAPGSGPAPGIKPAVKWGQSDSFLKAMELRAWVALIDNDAARGKENATALTTYASSLVPGITAALAGPRGEDWWRGIRPALNSTDDLAFSYDWTFPFMTPEQAATVRKTIALGTNGRYTLGMDQPHHWRTWNFIGMSLSEPILALAIEGEEGYDHRIYDRGIEVARDYLTYSITDKGFGKEGIGYQTAGLGHAQLILLAAANRGTNLFLHPHYQRYVSTYLYSAMQPWGGGWLSEGDLASFPPNFPVAMLAKFFFPNNPLVNQVLRNHPMERENRPAAGLVGNFSETLLVTPADPDTNAPDTAPAEPDVPQTLYDPTRGMLITRSDWSPDATVMHLDCRVDTAFAAHDHADRGEFTLSALGVPWVIKGMRDTETKYHSCITIDGHGQGYFPTPGKWIGMTDGADATFGTLDMKYCWDWFWMKAIMLEPVDQLKAEGEEAYIEPEARLLGRFPRSMWERDPSPNAVNFYHGFLAGDPRMWGEDSWVTRAPNYPVQKAFRTAGLVRGKHPYVVVVDDIQKDDQEHLYEWRMMCPVSVDVVDIKGNDIMLSGKVADPNNPEDKTPPAPSSDKGTPRLLVRGLNINQPALPTLQPNPTLETVELKKHDDTHQFAGRSNGLAKRLVLPSRSVAPDYKVLLVPYREGSELPVTTWNDDKTQLTIDWADQHDVVTFSKDPAGRTAVKITRDNQSIVQTP